MNTFHSIMIVFLVAHLTPRAHAQDAVKIDADGAASRAVEVSALSRAAAGWVAEARESVAAADALRFPELSLRAGLARQSSVPEFSLPISLPGTSPLVLYPNIESTGQAGVHLQQLVYSGGSIKAQRLGARSQLAAKTAEASMTHADLALSARLVFWQAVAQRAALAAAQTQAKRANRLLEDARAYRQVGMAVDADVFAAESRKAMAEVQVIERRAAAKNAMQELRSLLLIDANRDIELDDTPSQIKLEEPADLIAEALISRPELLGLQRTQEAVAQQAASVDAQRKPTVSAIAQWDYLRPNQRYFPIEDDWNDSWQVGVMASWKLFDGGRLRKQAAAIRCQSDVLKAQRAEQERRVILEVRTACRDVQAAKAKIEASEVALRAATSRETTTQERYDAGLAPISEVLDAQAELAEAELSMVRARAETSIALARLLRAVGR